MTLRGGILIWQQHGQPLEKHSLKRPSCNFFPFNLLLKTVINTFWSSHGPQEEHKEFDNMVQNYIAPATQAISWVGAGYIAAVITVSLAKQFYQLPCLWCVLPLTLTVEWTVFSYQRVWSSHCDFDFEVSVVQKLSKSSVSRWWFSRSKTLSRWESTLSMKTPLSLRCLEMVKNIQVANDSFPLVMSRR